MGCSLRSANAPPCEVGTDGSASRFTASCGNQPVEHTGADTWSAACTQVSLKRVCLTLLELGTLEHSFEHQSHQVYEYGLESSAYRSARLDNVGFEPQQCSLKLAGLPVCPVVLLENTTMCNKEHIHCYMTGFTDEAALCRSSC